MCFLIDFDENPTNNFLDQIEINRDLFQELNKQIPEETKHAINKIYHRDGKIIAGRCNCGRKKYHLIGIDNSVDWESKIIPSKLNLLRGINVPRKERKLKIVSSVN